MKCNHMNVNLLFKAFSRSNIILEPTKEKIKILVFLQIFVCLWNHIQILIFMSFLILHEILKHFEFKNVHEKLF